VFIASVIRLIRQNDAGDIVTAIRTLLADRELALRLREGGMARAKNTSAQKDGAPDCSSRMWRRGDLPQAFVPRHYGPVPDSRLAVSLNVCIFPFPETCLLSAQVLCPSCRNMWRLGGSWNGVLRGRAAGIVRTQLACLTYWLRSSLPSRFLVVIGIYGVSLPAAKWIVYRVLLIILFWTDWQRRILPDGVHGRRLRSWPRLCV